MEEPVEYNADPQGFVNGIYRSAGTFEMGQGFVTLQERAHLLRKISKSLISQEIPRETRRRVILDLCDLFAVELSDRGLDHFLDP